MDEQNNNNLKDKLNQFQQKIQDGLQGKLKLGKDKTLNTITMSLGVLGAVCIVYVIISNLNKIREKSVYGNLDCVKATTNYTVDDDNMASLFS